MLVARPLVLRSSLLSKYMGILRSSSEHLPDHLRTAHELARIALESKQCNEPYEMLLADLLGVQKISSKHGWDAADDLEDTREVYEFKPTIKKNLNVSINDDSASKIEKTENLEKENKKGWLILARIDRDIYSFDRIFKFPIDIYQESRKRDLIRIMEKNRQTNTQTRCCYRISLAHSIRLCQDQQKPFFFWEK